MVAAKMLNIAILSSTAALYQSEALQIRGKKWLQCFGVRDRTTQEKKEEPVIFGSISGAQEAASPESRSKAVSLSYEEANNDYSVPTSPSGSTTNQPSPRPFADQPSTSMAHHNGQQTYKAPPRNKAHRPAVHSSWGFGDDDENDYQLSVPETFRYEDAVQQATI